MSTTRLEHLMQFLEQTPKDSFLMFALAKEYEKLGRTADALAAYEQLRSNDAAYIGLYYHLGKLYEHTNNREAAYRAYKEGIKQAKKYGDNHAYNELVAAKMELGDDDEFELE
jgi:predicted Zn-dependent protease